MLGEQMAILLAERFVATQVEATLLAPRAFFWLEDFDVAGAQIDTGAAGPAPRTGEKKSRLVQLIGNVGRNTTITFRFGIKPDQKVDPKTRLPFQVLLPSLIKFSLFDY